MKRIALIGLFVLIAMTAHAADVTLEITVPEAKVAQALEFFQNWADFPGYWAKAQEALPEGNNKQLAEKCLQLKLGHDLGRYLKQKAQATVESGSGDDVFTAS